VSVLFTRTIRRKLLLGVGLVMVMLLILSVSAISALNSFSNLIRQLDDDINVAPQQVELVNAAGAIFEPLLWPVKNSVQARAQEGRLEELIPRANDKVLEFRRRCDALPPSGIRNGQQPVTNVRLQEYEATLKTLNELEETLATEPSRPETVRRMTDEVSQLVT